MTEDKRFTMAALNGLFFEPCGYCGEPVQLLDHCGDSATTSVVNTFVPPPARWCWPVCNDECAEALIAQHITKGSKRKHLDVIRPARSAGLGLSDGD